MKLTALIPLAIFIGLLGFFAIGLTKDPSELPSQLLDRAVPEFALTDLYDESITLTHENLTGQVSLVNVFGSWCVACVQEHPMLLHISQNTAVNLIGINWRDKRPAAKNWLAQYGDPYTRIVFDPKSELAIPMGVSGAPETYVVDKAGRVRYKHTGIITPDVWDATLGPVVKQLEEGT